MATRRTTHRSTAGKKLYAVRNAQGEFLDIQTYERAHGQDIKRKSKAETAAKSAKAAKPKKRSGGATKAGATRKAARPGKTGTTRTRSSRKR